MAERLPPDQVWNKLLEQIPEGAVITAAVAAVEYSVIDDDGEPQVYLRREFDTDSGGWKHAGICGTLLSDFESRIAFRVDEEEDEA